MIDTAELGRKEQEKVMVRKRMIVFAAAAFIGGMSFTPSIASADWYGNGHRGDIRADRQDLQADRFDLRRDRGDLRRDWHDLGRDLRFGSGANIGRDLSNIHHDRMYLRRDRRDFRHDRRELFWDRRGF
jgi:hypothetical protein